MNSQDLKKIELPNSSGVYLFLGPPKHVAKDARKSEILYIGKATSLRDRVRSYFGKDLIQTRGMLLVDMVTKAHHIDFIETDSVLEALILEADLIKKYNPYYNTKEKDDKSFLCVVITDEKLPQVLQVRKKDIDFDSNLAKLKAKIYKLKTVYGPFASGSQLREAMKIIRRIFPYIDTSSMKKDNYEFYRQLGLSPDVFLPLHKGEIKRGSKTTPAFSHPSLERRGNSDIIKEYAKTIKNIQLFFEGKKKKIISNLKKEMLAYAKAKEFEQAGEIKRRIFALEHINDTALIKNDFLDSIGPSYQIGRAYRIEAYDIAHTSGKNMIGVMVVLENGEINKNEYRQFNIKTVMGANDPASLAEVLSRRLGHATWELPQLIIVDGNSIQKNSAEKILKTKGFNIPVVAVVKDERHRAREILGEKGIILKYKKAILLANSEAHRFSITLHRKKRSKDFLK